MNIKKKYCFVKELPTQDGGYVPVRVVATVPQIILGNPLKGYKTIPIIPPGLSMHNAMTKINIASNSFVVTISLPFRRIKSTVDSIIRWTYIVKNKNDKPTDFYIITPTYNKRIQTSLRQLLASLKKLGLHYNVTNLYNSLSKYTPYGKQRLNTYSLARIIDFIKKKLKKKGISSENSKKYTSITID
jgi:hypothetical protein